MLNWETWTELHTTARVNLSDGFNMAGSYMYHITSDDALNGVWQTHIIANTNQINAGNFKIRALVRKDNNNGALYLFGRANKSTKLAYILELTDILRIYKGTLGEQLVPQEGVELVNSGFVLPKNITYHVEFAIHTEPDNKTFMQVKLGDREDPEMWRTVFSVIVENETALTGYWGFGCGTLHRRENFMFDNIEYFIEY